MNNKQYLIVSVKNNFQPFSTNWFSVENNFNDDMIVFDCYYGRYLSADTNGEWWIVEEDHL